MPDEGERYVSVRFNDREIERTLEPFEAFCEEHGISRSEGVKLAMDHFRWSVGALMAAGYHAGDGLADGVARRDRYHATREALEAWLEAEGVTPDMDG